MKVPIMYKSSERYKAGTDIVYDDGSKLQYPPFIYAVAESGDSGGDGGDDEEGEDNMVVNYDSVTGLLDKTYKEMKDAVDSGKIVMIVSDFGGPGMTMISYLEALTHQSEAPYYAYFSTANIAEESTDLIGFSSESETGTMLVMDPA